MNYQNRNPRERRVVPHEIYVRRRIAAVCIVVILLALVWWIVSLVTNHDDMDNSMTTHSTTATSRSIDATSPATPPNAKTQSPQDATSASHTALGQQKTCSLTDLKVSATPGEPFFTADKQPNFFIQVNNPTGADCMIDTSTAPLKFEVFTLSNYQRVWADSDCDARNSPGKITIPAGKTVNYEFAAWSRTTSSPQSCDHRQKVGAGSYLLYGHLGTVVSDPATFNLG